MVGLMTNKIKPAEYGEMVDLALSLLQDYGFKTFPLNLNKLCKFLNITLIPYSALSFEQYDIIIKKGLKSGFTVVSKHVNGVAYYDTYYNNVDEKKERNRFTIAHEIKHVVNGDFTKVKNEKDEELADYFAKCLLAPQCVLITNKIYNLDIVHSKFQISKHCAEIWLNTVCKRICRYGDHCLTSSEKDFISFLNSDYS